MAVLARVRRQGVLVMPQDAVQAKSSIYKEITKIFHQKAIKWRLSSLLGPYFCVGTGRKEVTKHEFTLRDTKGKYFTLTLFPKLFAFQGEEAHALSVGVEHPNIEKTLWAATFIKGEVAKTRVPQEQVVIATLSERQPGWTNLKERVGKLSARELQEIGMGIARALQHLHEEGLLHRGIRASNVLMSPGGQVKLIGLESVRKLSENGVMPHDLTSRDLSPECIHNIRAQGVNMMSTYGKEIDVFAFGLLLFHLKHGIHPNESFEFEAEILTSYLESYQDIEGIYGRYPDLYDISDPICLLIACLTQFKQDERLSIPDALELLESVDYSSSEESESLSDTEEAVALPAGTLESLVNFFSSIIASFSRS